MTRLSTITLARDEEANIAACLDSLAWADERIVVLDPRTHDRTAELARQAGARVVARPFVNFCDQHQAALALPENDWVLSVDADERVTPELAAEIRQAIAQPSPVGWWVPRQNIIWGRWIRHTGWYPDYQLRLMRRSRVRYDPEREVHELVIVDGQVGHLQHPLIHYNYRTVGEFLRKTERYTLLEAGILAKAGAKPRLRSLVGQPLREFWRRYVTYQGYRDGGHGLLLSLLMAYYRGLTYWRLRQLVG
ncbi:MAG TPA: glycosyltransferase family 2 protein [Anaerolineae bacterium]|nr:glycosyltransferase family 2 protein [Anaerolineae bacterium]